MPIICRETGTHAKQNCLNSYSGNVVVWRFCISTEKYMHTSHINIHMQVAILKNMRKAYPGFLVDAFHKHIPMEADSVAMCASFCSIASTRQGLRIRVGSLSDRRSLLLLLLVVVVLLMYLLQIGRRPVIAGGRQDRRSLRIASSSTASSTVAIITCN